MDAKTIENVIEADIVESLEYINELTFSGTVILQKILEMELGRTRLERDEIFKSMRESYDEAVDLDRLSRLFVGTYVKEQRILDRISLTDKFKGEKGVK